MSDKISSKSAFRMKKMRERLKKENSDFQNQENRRVSELKKKKRDQMTEKELKKMREYECVRKRIQRQKNKAKRNKNVVEVPMNSNTEFPYTSPQSFGKAVWRTIKSLPKSPRKQKAVVSGLVNRIGMSSNNEMAGTSNANEDFSNVINFYNRPDIVYTCPGLKDRVTVWENGKKLILQKFYLTMFLKEAFFIFKEENPSFEIGFSKFCSLRPKNVLLLKDTPSDQCKCIIHENFLLKLKALKITYSNAFWEQILCNNNADSECWRNTCEKCCDGRLFSISDDLDELVVWKVWENNNGKVQLHTKETQIGDLVEAIIEGMPKMLKHVNVKRIQHLAFEKDKKEKDIRILQIDFAMSFSCEYQDEIQSALWSRASVLLFTAAVFFNGSCQTYLICSDTSNKDKDSIFVFIEFLYQEIFQSDENPPKEEVIWSDGPSSEFKNKYMAKLLCIFTEKYKGKKFTWKRGS